MLYDCIIVGGGIAGLQAAIQLGRYSCHRVLVVDTGYGRSTLCRSYHNILGWPDGVSGEELRRIGREQAERLGVQFAHDEIEKADKTESGFRIHGKSGEAYQARTLLLATGLLDRFPMLPGLVICLGRSVYVCPDCDGYEVENRKTVVLGSGAPGANMAMLLCKRTREMIYINHERVTLPKETKKNLARLGIRYVKEEAASIRTEGDGHITGVELVSGKVIPAERGFIAFGGNEVNSDLARQLGIERLENKHVVVDPRSKMSNVENVWCAGDLVAHSEQTTIAMGEGMQAAIWINKKLTGMKEAGASAKQW